MINRKSMLSSMTLASIALVGALALAGTANANPFGLNDLSSSGYEVAMGGGKCGDKEKEGKCGEGKCGAKDAKDAGSKGKCGEGKCGAKDAKDASSEGKCGEGKCGAKDAKDAGSKSKCGAGKCGAGKCGSK